MPAQRSPQKVSDLVALSAVLPSSFIHPVNTDWVSNGSRMLGVWPCTRQSQVS